MAPQAIVEKGQVMASGRGARDGSAARCGVGQAAGSSAGVTAGGGVASTQQGASRARMPRDGRTTARTVPRGGLAVGAIDPRVDFPLQSYGVGREWKPTGWRILCALPGSSRGNLLRWPCQLLIVPYEKLCDVCPVLPDMMQGESCFG